MIYINENTNVVQIPKVALSAQANLRFTHQLTGRTITIENPVDLEPNNAYYAIDLTDHISEFLTGQYDYVITGVTGEILASGIAQFGDFIPEIKTYETPESEIKTYER